MSDNSRQLQQQQQAWHNYYAYQQLYSQQPPAYPFAPPSNQPHNISSPLAWSTTGSTPYAQTQYSIPGPPPPKRPRTDVAIEKPSYHCDACDLTLESSIAHSAHLKSHTVCSECSFSASPKLVKAHHAAVHGKFRGNGFKTITVAIPGCKVQRYRICVGNHPDDVKKWIADRKKKFPRQKPVPVKEEPQFSGLLDGYGSSSSEENGGSIQVESKIDTSAQAVGTEQMKSWDSGSKQDKSLQIPIPTAGSTDAVTESGTTSNYRSQICRYFARNGRCRNGDTCNFAHERCNPNQPPISTSISKSTHKQPDRTNNRPTRGSATRTGTTLLRALLDSDANRERTLTLQLLRHIMDCNFMQKEQSTRDESVLRNLTLVTLESSEGGAQSAG